MRLIDADAFRRILIEIQTDAEYFDNVQRRNDIGSIIALIDNQPTAFDIDKVFKELEKAKTINVDVGFGTIYETIQKDVALEIVKQGGVADDVCEWELDGVYLNSPHKPLVSCVNEENYRYYYCPVCGKKIKVVE